MTSSSTWVRASARMPGWLGSIDELLQGNESIVLVTVIKVRGHAPRAAGAKMVVSSEQVLGSVGGGNLEMSAIERARELLVQRERHPVVMEVSLTANSGGLFGVQCCGGEVTLLLERIVARPQVVIFGAGHVGLALAQVLSTLPLEIELIDSRPEMLAKAKDHPGLAGIVRTKALFAPDYPEEVVASLRAGAHVVILTHDHAEDLAILRAALARADLGYLGLIGSSAKWARFRTQLLASGFAEADLERVTTPIGIPVPTKTPGAIAIAAAAQLLNRLELNESMD